MADYQLGPDFEIARRAKRGGSGRVRTFALQNKSLGVLDSLALAASGGSLRREELVSRLLSEPGDVVSLERRALVALATAIGAQRADPRSTFVCASLLRAVVDFCGVEALSDDDRLVLVEQLAALGLTEQVVEYGRMLGVDRVGHGHLSLLRANAVNPFSGEQSESSDLPNGMDAWLDLVNAMFAIDGAEPVTIVPGPEDPFDRIGCAAGSLRASGPLVTVMVPTYSPGPRIETALESLLAQSHQNLQVIVLDDASPSAEAERLDWWASRDPRITVVHLPERGGTYKARNYAVSTLARGDYITVHDDDDWSHPRKIERQVAHLERNQECWGNMSLMVRATPELQFARINASPILSQVNYSSLMLRRSVFDAIGYWDEVNRSADVEFVERMSVATGEKPVVVGRSALAFLRVRDNSLTHGEINAGYLDKRRVWYRRLSRWWHARAEADGSLFVGRDPDKRPFPAPLSMLGYRDRQASAEVDVVYIADYRLTDAGVSAACAEIEALVASGKRVAVVQLDSPSVPSTAPLDPRVAELLDGEEVVIVSPDDQVVAPLTVVRNPIVAQYLPPVVSSIRTTTAAVVVEEVVSAGMGDQVLFDPDDIVNNLATVLGCVPTVVPTGAPARAALEGLVAPEHIADYDWSVDVVDGIRTEARAVADRAVVEKVEETERYLLCRPCGGLNDMLCQIQKCYSYAKKYRRTLYIDTTVTNFFDEFSHYFEEPDGIMFRSMPNELWDSLSKAPDVLMGRSLDYQVKTVLDENHKAIRALVGTTTSLTFDFTTDHPEDILVHHSSGGGSASNRVWGWLRLREDLRRSIKAKMDALGKYDAVHVRNTDRRTNYVTLFTELDKVLGDRVVLCTDDPRCREHAAEVLGPRLLPTDFVENQTGRPLYYQRLDDQTRRQANIATLTDLFLLAGACHLYVGELEGANVARSGYSNLAAFLHDHPDVLASVIEE